MWIGVVSAGVVVHRVDHDRRLLWGGGAVRGGQAAPGEVAAQDREIGTNRLGVERTRLDHAGRASFIRSATVTDSSVGVIVVCRRSQKACAEQGVSAWVHSPGPPPSARQVTGAREPSRLRTMSAIEIDAGCRASA